MRLTVLLVVSLTASYTSISEDDACHFAASRFARADSRCENGNCTGIGLHGTGQIVFQIPEAIPVSCQEATDIVTMELRYYYPPGNELITADGILSSLRDEVVPACRLLQLGGLADPESFTISLGELHASIAELAAFDWDRWITLHAPLVEASDEFRDFHIAVGGLLRVLHESSVLNAVHHALLHDAILFYFDLSAFLGMHAISDVPRSLLGLAVQFAQPSYRAPASRDILVMSSATEVADTDSVLALTNFIDSVANGAEMRDPPTVEITAILRLLGSSAKLSDSSTVALLKHQIATSLCPTLPSSLMLLGRWVWHPFAIIQLGIALMEVCQQVVARGILARARDVLAFFARPLEQGYFVPEEAEMEAFLKNDTIPWPLGMRLDSEPIRCAFAPIKVSNFITGSLIELVPLKGSPELNGFRLRGEDTRASALAFGRALGFILRYRGNLRQLKLAPSFAAALHPRNRRRMGSLTELAIMIIGGPSEPRDVDDENIILNFFFITVGLSEALGPGGFELFPDQDWIAQFITVDSTP